MHMFNSPLFNECKFFIKHDITGGETVNGFALASSNNAEIY